MDQFVCTDANLIINTATPGKPPLEFDIKTLRIKEVGPGQPMPFEATLVPRATPGRVTVVAVVMGRSFGCSTLASPKSRILMRPFFGDEHIVGLEVAMNDSFFVSGAEAVGDLNPVIDDDSEGKRSAAERFGEGLALEQFRQNVAHAIVASHLVDG